MTDTKQISINLSTYMKIIDTRSGDGVDTGVGAIFDTPQETIEAFESARNLEKKGGSFLLDLHVNDDLVDTIELSQESAEYISGEKFAATGE